MDISQQKSRLLASLLLIGVTSISGGCVGEGGVATATIFKSDGSVQCDQAFNKSQSLSTQSQSLVASGIDVINQACGVLTSASVTEVCGAPTLNINLFQVPAASVTDANRLGFNSTALVQFEQAECGGAGGGGDSLSSIVGGGAPSTSQPGGNNDGSSANDVFGGIL